ncbi:DUF167 domain-containing protein [Persephonella sp.]
MLIKVKVKPKSKKEEVKHIGEDYYEVKVNEIPEKGKANKRVIELLSKYFKIPKSEIVLIKGSKSKEKIFKIKE